MMKLQHAFITFLSFRDVHPIMSWVCVYNAKSSNLKTIYRLMEGTLFTYKYMLSYCLGRDNYI